MPSPVDDLRAECRELGGLLAALAPADWTRTTAFFAWTIVDEVMHLHLVDTFGLVSLADPGTFPALVADVRAGQAQGIELSDRMRAQHGALTPDALLSAWHARWERLCVILAERSAEDRIPWFGPEMSVASFTAARQMEVWAHGQDIYDVLRRRRAGHDRIRAICDLGVRTQGWSFRNRQLDRPPPPAVRLTGPSGAKWVWNEGAAGRIAGPAEDFALVVTQRRHVDDTALAVDGDAARAWMAIAQCFAGAPETGPAPGVRRVDLAD